MSTVDAARWSRRTTAAATAPNAAPAPSSRGHRSLPAHKMGGPWRLGRVAPGSRWVTATAEAPRGHQPSPRARQGRLRRPRRAAPGSRRTTAAAAVRPIPAAAPSPASPPLPPCASRAVLGASAGLAPDRARPPLPPKHRAAANPPRVQGGRAPAALPPDRAGPQHRAAATTHKRRVAPGTPAGNGPSPPYSAGRACHHGVAGARPGPHPQLHVPLRSRLQHVQLAGNPPATGSQIDLGGRPAADADPDLT